MHWNRRAGGYSGNLWSWMSLGPLLLSRSYSASLTTLRLPDVRHKQWRSLYPIPDKFILEPCNSVGVLLHWKALLLIAASLTEEERGYWRKTFQAPEDAELQDVQPAVQQRINPEHLIHISIWTALCARCFSHLMELWMVYFSRHQ